MQTDSEGNEVPIAYMSRKLNQCQRNYSVTAKECLAAVMIVHRKGSQNVVPDALSRVFTEDLSAIQFDSFVNLESEHFKDAKYVEIKERIQNNSPRLPDLKVIDQFVYRRMEHATGDKIADDSCWKLWIPEGLIPEVLNQCHEHPLAAHSGVIKTLERIRRYYYWPNLVADVREFINKCLSVSVANTQIIRCDRLWGSLQKVKGSFRNCILIF